MVWWHSGSGKERREWEEGRGMGKQREGEEGGDTRNKKDRVGNRGWQGQREERIARGFGQEVMSSRRSMPCDLLSPRGSNYSLLPINNVGMPMVQSPFSSLPWAGTKPLIRDPLKEYFILKSYHHSMKFTDTPSDLVHFLPLVYPMESPTVFWSFKHGYTLPDLRCCFGEVSFCIGDTSSLCLTE